MRLFSGARVTALVAVVMTVSGCGTGMIGGSRVWVPQGPGEVPEPREAPAPRRAPAPVAKAEQAPAVSPFRPGAPGSAPAPAAAPATPQRAASATGSGTAGYTQATRYGDLLFVSGQIALDPRTNQFVGDKIEDQTRQVMENIRLILENNRLTMANVVSVTVYMKDLAQFRGMDETYETFFRTALPARSVVEVARLPRGAMVEISVVAGR